MPHKTCHNWNTEVAATVARGQPNVLCDRPNLAGTFLLGMYSLEVVPECRNRSLRGLPTVNKNIDK